MASRGEVLPEASSSSTIDEAGKWFWDFLKTELAPYPGRAWVVARITIAATLVMLAVMTFRIPSGFLAAIYTFFLSRENPTATLRSGVRMILAFAVGTAYSIVGLMTMIDDPLTHFLWIVVTLFIAFYLIKIVPDYGTAVGFGFMIAGVIPLWDQTTLNVNDRVENTLWLAFTVVLGSAATIVVEYVFRRVHPTTDLTEGIENRLQVAEDVLKNIAAGFPHDGQLEKNIALYSSVGTARLRRLLHRSGYSSHFIAQMNAAVSLLGRLVDLSASLRIFIVDQKITPTQEDKERCLHLANEITELRQDLRVRTVPRSIKLPDYKEPSKLPFLLNMERTVVLIPQAFSGSDSMEEFIPAPIDERTKENLIAPDAFSNPAYLQFAIRGMLSATACYVVYTSIDWRGLSTSIATCIITALSTIGSSRQKQFLRLGGALIGGFVFGMGAQVFVLPYLNSIVGFTVLFALVTAISAWIATASPKLSYLGVQLALAFYLINLQEFTIQTSLAIARDRIFGVLLGLFSMWLIFDRLWMRNALEEMQRVFTRNLEMLAELAEQMLNEDREAAVQRIRQLRDQINAGFQAVTAQSDAIVFEFGSSRARKLKIRDDVRRWQPSLRTLLLVEITASQYSVQRPLKELPQTLSQARIAFEKDTARMIRAMADEVSEKMIEGVPNIQESAARLEREISGYYREQGQPISPQASDIIRLSETIASILAPLHEDIHETFAGVHKDVNGMIQPNLGEA